MSGTHPISILSAIAAVAAVLGLGAPSWAGDPQVSGDPFAVPSAAWRGEGPDLDRIVRSIRTVAELADGSTKAYVGGGFVVGQRYFTVHHNLDVRSPGVIRTTSYIDGVALRPTRVSRAEDLAVIDLPSALCGRFCNEDRLRSVPKLRSGQEVHWLRKLPGEYSWKSARVMGYAFLEGEWTPVEEITDRACDQNVIVEVDVPFVSGTSGSPVVDSETGRIVGIVQGSLERSNGASGFFKPIECAMRMVDERIAGLPPAAQ